MTRAGCNDGEQFVFVGVVQDRNAAERRVFRVSSVERLSLLKDCLGRRIHPLNASGRESVPLLGGQKYGELCLGTIRVASSESPRDVVEPGTQIVNAIPDDKPPISGGDFGGAV